MSLTANFMRYCKDMYNIWYCTTHASDFVTNNLWGFWYLQWNRFQTIKPCPFSASSIVFLSLQCTKIRQTGSVSHRMNIDEWKWRCRVWWNFFLFCSYMWMYIIAGFFLLFIVFSSLKTGWYYHYLTNSIWPITSLIYVLDLWCFFLSWRYSCLCLL